jgi:hypothetical protein
MAKVSRVRSILFVIIVFFLSCVLGETLFIKGIMSRELSQIDAQAQGVAEIFQSRFVMVQITV